MQRHREIVLLRRKIFNAHRIAGAITGQLDSPEPELEDANAELARILVTFKEHDLLTRIVQQELGSPCEVQGHLGRSKRTKG
jgi:hypothetical protein